MIWPQNPRSHPAILFLGPSLAPLSLSPWIWVHLGHSSTTRLTSRWMGAWLLVVRLGQGRGLEASGWQSLRWPSNIGGCGLSSLTPPTPAPHLGLTHSPWTVARFIGVFLPKGHQPCSVGCRGSKVRYWLGQGFGQSPVLIIPLSLSLPRDSHE